MPIWSRSIPALVLLAIPALAGADDKPLPRRAWLGAALEAVPGGGGVRVRDVFAGSSAETGGLKPNDVLKTFDGKPVAALPELVRALRSAKAGAKVAFEVERGDKTETVSFALKEWPREADTDAYRVEYGGVDSKAGRLRTITLVPKKRGRPRAPGLLIMQGLTAATLDNSIPTAPIDRPVGMGVYRTIAAALADAGFVVMRVDKAGCGDSEGDATQLDFEGERDGYLASLKALKARDDVDPDRLFLFGHSMGGIIAPLLAGEVPVRGVAVYGTSIQTWFEYILENERRQVTLSGGNLVELDQLIRSSERFHHEYLVAKRRPSEIVDQTPELRAIAPILGVSGDLVFGRHYTFFHQLADLNAPEAWSKFGGDLLALWGEAEVVTSRRDHEQLAEFHNASHPGKGRFQMIPESDHGFGRQASPREAIQGNGMPAPFNPAIITVLRDWAVGVADRKDGA